MVKEMKYKMSEERLKELKDELNYLQTVREKEVAEQIKEARSFGDLSENSEYDEAKTEQGKLYSKIAELKNLIENAEVIKEADSKDVVSIGCTVAVRDMESGQTGIYDVVGSQEADPILSRISDESPFGRGILGKKKGEIAEIIAPTGILKFEILDIK